MKFFKLAILLMSAIVLSGCMAGYTLQRNRPIIHEAPDQIVYSGESGIMEQPIGSENLWFNGRFWNNGDVIVSVPLPASFWVSTQGTGLSRPVGNPMTYPGGWAHRKFVHLKPGWKSAWISTRGGQSIWLEYFYQRHNREPRGTFKLYTDYAPNDHMCQGEVVDWFVEIGRDTCR